MVTAFGGMLLLADRTVCAEILRRLGRHVLVQRVPSVKLRNFS